MSDTEPHEPTIVRGNPAEPHYPQEDKHTWGAFAGLAVELDGYNNLELVNPYNGDRITVYGVFPQLGEGEDQPFVAALHFAIDAAALAGFFDEKE